MWPKGLGFDSRWLQVLSLGYGGVCHHWWFRNDENPVCAWEARHWAHMAREMLKAKGLWLVSSTWKMLITLWEINMKPHRRLWWLLGSTLPHFYLLSPYVLTKKWKGMALCLAHGLMKRGCHSFKCIISWHYTVIQQLTLHPKCNYCFDHFLATHWFFLKCENLSKIN